VPPTKPHFFEDIFMSSLHYTVIYELAEDGGYYAHIPALDLTTEGDTLPEAKAMARDAIENTLSCLKELNMPYQAENTPFYHSPGRLDRG
jgi:predicted RNase H-like HicB family nuclease